jgi:hypothetical protein
VSRVWVHIFGCIRAAPLVPHTHAPHDHDQGSAAQVQALRTAGASRSAHVASIPRSGCCALACDSAIAQRKEGNTSGNSGTGGSTDDSRAAMAVRAVQGGTTRGVAEAGRRRGLYGAAMSCSVKGIGAARIWYPRRRPSRPSPHDLLSSLRYGAERRIQGDPTPGGFLRYCEGQRKSTHTSWLAIPVH